MNDRDEILRVHRLWNESNIGLDADAMAGLFAADGYLQFNLNGHVYHGVGEKVRLWRELKQLGASVREMHDVGEPEVFISGDLAYLTVEKLVHRVTPAGVEINRSDGALHTRATEVYRRNPGPDGPGWLIWHLHSSEYAPEERPRFPVSDAAVASSR